MKKIYFTILCVAILIAACRKTEVVETVETKPKTAKGIELGKKLENPYSVKNMRKAYKNLTSGTNSVQDDPIYTTHYYVRFLPADTAQYNKLKNDTTLRMYPYPLDYEISETGDDFGGDQDTPVWQYAAVKNDYQFDSNIETEVLEELYIPDDDYNPNDEVFTNGNSQTAFNRKLVDEAMRITNNLDYVSTKTNVKGSNGTQANPNVQVAWNPQGTIRVFDTRLNQYIPLIGVKVSARRWFTTRETYTNANGQYWLGSFSGPANYAVWYETGDFDIRSGWFGQAWYNGPKRNTPWNLDISGDVQRFYAHVFRGVRRFFYGNTGGLRRPNTSFFKGKIKYAARNSVGSQQGINYTTATQGGIFPDIQIWRYNSSREYASDEIFSTAVHETAHTTHMNSMNGPFELVQYFQVAKVIQESWPIAVEWQVTQMEYQERGISNYSNPFYSISASYPIDRAYQYWTPAVSADYTSLFIDIIDNHNQNSTNSAVIDNVGGYTLAYIESNLLRHIYGKSSLAAQLKTNKPYGVTNTDIDVLIFGVTPYTMPQLNSVWQAAPGTGTDIGVGADGSVYKIGTDLVSSTGGYSISKWNGTSWNALLGPTGVGYAGVRIAVDPSGKPWVINKSNLIFKYNGTTFDQISGTGTDIDVGADGSVYKIGTDLISSTTGYSISKWNGTSWSVLLDPAGMSYAGVRIAVDPSGKPWVINKSNLIFRYNGTTFDQIPGTGTDIDIGADGSVYKIGTDLVSSTGGYSISIWNGSSWQVVPYAAAVNIGITPQGRPWVTNKSNYIYNNL